MSKNGKNTKYDWDAIWREYTTGQFSDSELARRHGCSRAAIQKRVKKEKWERDNSQQVRTLANAKMVHEDAVAAHEVAPEVAGCNVRRQTSDPDKERSEIELAAETRVTVLRDHRKDIKRLREIEAQLLDELEDNPQKTFATAYKGCIDSLDINIPVTEKSQALNNLANVQHKRINLERVAFNLNDHGDEDDGLPTVIVHDPSAGGDDNA